MFKKIIPLLVLAVTIYACSSSSSDDVGPTDNFDRKAMLTNLADNIIVPSFQDFNSKLIVLKGKVEAFNNAPSTLTLEDARTAWYQAYKSWQWVEMFNIGKAEEIGFVNHFNIYPLTVADVESNISNGGYDLAHPNNHDAQGFPALDYLFYGVAADDNAIVAKYTTDTDAAKYKMYLTDVVAKMSEVMTTIVNDWNGGYKVSFANNSGNTATSSLNKLVNDFIYYYEKGLRANKVGIPAGNFSATTLPEKVEAFYKKTSSKELSLEALTAVQSFFNGTKFNAVSSGASFKTYLEALNKGDLVTKINNQFGLAKTQINGLNANFYEQINTNNTEMLKAYDELQKAVVLLKVDMLQAFNVSVDYVDADGD
ncbi:Peptidase M75 superfamily protein [Tenacibaculum sp. 190130A14a]|uniref:Peptidase M75 superfamily protein n=1 Tax=Tenacibaculum polynesiense TaxID=3137857 RepID=A0ABM9PF78_9FLAO